MDTTKRINDNRESEVAPQNSELDNSVCDKTPLGEPKMQECSSSSNVVIQELSDGFTSNPTHADSNLIHSFNSVESVDEFVSVMSRWHMLTVFNWDNSKVTGVKLAEIDVWDDVFTSINALPSSMVLDMFRYFRSDIEFKIVLNSNDFQSGQIIAAFRYSHKMDKYSDIKENIYLLPQTNHVLISAGSGAEGTIYIHHNTPVNYFTINDKRKDFTTLGTLLISVIAPLQSVGDDMVSVDVSVFAKFTNVNLSGMISRDLYNEQMLPSMIALKLLDQTFADKNRDKPPDQQCSVVMKPTSNQSLSLGANICEPLHALRLDATGQTPHPGLSSDEDLLSKITSIYGFIDQLRWTTKDPASTRLKIFEATPLFSRNSNYPLVVSGEHKAGSSVGLLSSYALPPIAVATSLAQYYSGDVQFRFDMIATRHHSGRLLVAFVPGSLVQNLRLRQARGSAHAVFTLCSATQFNFTIPFINDRPVQSKSRTNHGNDIIEPIGYLYIFVLNALRAPQNAPQTVYINVYKRGSENFKLYVLSAPTIGLGYDRGFVLDKNDLIVAKAGYYPYYTGVWHSWLDSNYLIFRYGAASDQVAQFEGGKAGDIGKRIVTYVKDHQLPNYYDGQKKMQKIDWIGLIEISGYIYGVPFVDHSRASSWQNSVRQGTAMHDAYRTYGIRYTQAGDYYDKFYGNVEYAFGDDYFKEQMDPRVQDVGDVCTVVPPRNPIGRNLFGERPLDFKDACRRYGLYFAHKDLVIRSDRDFMGAIWKLPICLEGIDMEGNLQDEFFTRVRENHLQILTSAYPYYRGSIRLKIFPNNFDILWVQHQFDHHNLDRTVQIVQGSRNSVDMLNSSYAIHQIDCSVNPVLEIEVPFYNPGKFCYNYKFSQRSNKRGLEFNGLGNILIGGVPNKGNVSLYVYMSIGDDLQLFNFQGFPPMVFIDQIPQLNKIYYEQGMVDKVVDQISVPVVKEVAEQGNKVTGMLASFIEWLKGSFLGKLVSSVKNLIVGVISQVLHVLVHPTILTISLSVGSILLLVGFFPESWYKKIVSCVKRFWRWLTGKSDDNAEITSGTPVVQEQSDEVVPAMCSTVYGAICAAMSVKSAYSSNKYRSDFEKSFTGMGRIARDGNQIFIFFKNMLDMISKFVKDIVRIKAPILDDLDTIKSINIKEWIVECDLILDPKNFDNVRDNELWRRRLNTCVFTATQLCHHADIVYEATKEYIPIFKDYKNSLTKLEREIGSVTSRPCKVEPYVIWLHGEPGVGKSTVAEIIAARVLAHVGYKHTGSQFSYTVQPLCKHWDQLAGAPVLIYDDFFSVKSVDFAAETSFMSLKSCSTFVPPRARIDDKGSEYNPQIIVVCSNFFGSDGQPGIQNYDAFNRRREIVIKVQSKPGVERDSENFSHLEFFMSDNVKKEETYTNMNDLNSVCTHIGNELKDHQRKQIDLAIHKLKSLALIDVTGSVNKNLNALKEIGNYFEQGPEFQWWCPVKDKYINVMEHCCDDCLFAKSTYYSYDTTRCLFCDFPIINEVTAYASGYFMHGNSVYHIAKLCPVHSNDVHYAKLLAQIQDQCFLCTSRHEIKDCGMLGYLKRNHMALCKRESIYKKKDKAVEMVLKSSVVEQKDCMIKRWYKKSKDWIWNYILKSVAWIRKHKKTIAYICIAMGGLGSIFGLSKVFFKSSAVASASIVAVVKEQLIPSGSESVNAGRITNAIYDKLMSPQSTREVGNSPMEIITKIVTDNTCFLRNTTRGLICRILAVNGNRFVGVDHYFDNYKDDDLIKLIYIEGGISKHILFKFKQSYLEPIKNSRLVKIVIPDSHKTFRSIIKHFARALEHTLVPNSGHVVEASIEKDDMSRIVKIYHSKLGYGNINVQSVNRSETYNVQNVYCYSIEHPGLCGSILVVNHKIYGMHFAGGSGEGFSEPMCKEQFDIDVTSTLNHNSYNLDDFLEKASQVTEQCDALLKQKGFSKFKVDDKLKHHERGEASVFKSSIHGILPVLRQPPILSIRDPRNVMKFDPLQEGLMKQLNGPKNLDLDIVEQVNFYWRYEFKRLNTCSSIKLRPLTFSEAINGRPGVIGYQGLTVSTSPGWPYNKLYPGNGKDKFLAQTSVNGVIIYEATDLLLNVMKEEIQLRLDNKRRTVFENCLKSNNLIPTDKVTIPGKTRIINMSPLPYTILYRKYFMHVLAAVQNNMIKNTSAIGISRNSEDWTTLFKHLFTDNEFGCSGDFSNFGPTLYKAFVINAHRILYEWTIEHCKLTDNDKKIMQSLCYDAINALYLHNDTVYSVDWGSPSGHPATVIINDLVAKHILTYSWIKIMNEGPDKMLTNIKLCTYGDDVIFTSNQDILEKFNTASISKLLSEYNIKFTDADKTSLVVTYLHYDKLTFLKSGFVKFMVKDNYGVVLAPLPPSSYRDIPNWVKRTSDIRGDTLQVCESANSEAFGIGPDEHEKFRIELSKALQERGIEHNLKVWHELFDQFFPNLWTGSNDHDLSDIE